MVSRGAAHSLFLVLAIAATAGVGCGGGNAPTAEIQGGSSPAPVDAAAGSPAAPEGEIDWPPPTPPVSLHPEVLIKTSQGDIVVRLDRERAPITVDNFLSYIEQKFYDDTLIHFVAKDSMVLCGAYTREWREKPAGAPILCEAANGLTHRRGTIGMSRNPDDVHSATSQFFFSLTENEALNHQNDETVEGYGYCAFGEVTKGLDVLERISRLPTAEKAGLSSAPASDVVVQSVTILR